MTVVDTPQPPGDPMLTAAELDMLWRLARRLQACGSLAEAEELATAVAATAQDGSPAYAQAVVAT